MSDDPQETKKIVDDTTEDPTATPDPAAATENDPEAADKNGIEEAVVTPKDGADGEGGAADKDDAEDKEDTGDADAQDLSSATDGTTEVTFSIIFDDDDDDDDADARDANDANDTDGTSDADDADNTDGTVGASEDADDTDDTDSTNVTNPDDASRPASAETPDADSDAAAKETIHESAVESEPPTAEDPSEGASEDATESGAEDPDDMASSPADALSIERGITAAIRSTRQEDDIILRSYPTFSLTDVSVVKKSGGRRILDDVTMSLYAGNLYCVGVDPDYVEQHSTFMQIITGLRRPTSGTVMMRSANLAELDAAEARGHRLGIVTQKYRVRDNLNAIDNIVYAMDASNRNFLKPKKAIAKELLEHVGFADDDTTTDKAGTNSPYQVKAGTLTPVQQLRVAIARAISCEAEVLILDEPTVGLDAADSENIMDTLQSLAHDRDPRCVIVVSSDEGILDFGEERIDLI